MGLRRLSRESLPESMRRIGRRHANYSLRAPNAILRDSQTHTSHTPQVSTTNTSSCAFASGGSVVTLGQWVSISSSVATCPSTAAVALSRTRRSSARRRAARQGDAAQSSRGLRTRCGHSRVVMLTVQ